MSPTDREVDRLFSEIGALRTSVDEVKATLAEQKGERNTLRWIAGFFGIGTLSGLLALWKQMSGGH